MRGLGFWGLGFWGSGFWGLGFRDLRCKGWGPCVGVLRALGGLGSREHLDSFDGEFAYYGDVR